MADSTGGGAKKLWLMLNVASDAAILHDPEGGFTSLTGRGPPADPSRLEGLIRAGAQIPTGICLALINLPRSLVEAVKILEGEPVDKSIRSILLARIRARLKENESKAAEYAKKYGSTRRLREKILHRSHGWDEERELFDWEALVTENEQLGEFLKEEGA